MAGKSKFTIPSLDEMESAPQTSFKAKDLMVAHKEGGEKLKPKPSGSGDTSSARERPSVICKLPAQPASTLNQLSSQTSASSQPSSFTSKDTGTISSQLTKPNSSSGQFVPSQTTDRAVKRQGVQPGASAMTSASVIKPTVMYKPINAAGQKDDAAAVTTGAGVPGSSGKTGKTSILVSPRQRGNPILKFVRNVPWEFDDIVPDYQLARTTCALFLSLRYHQLNPDYIHERLKKLGHSYDLRILLVHIDVKEPHHSLKELAKVCILADCTLMVAFSPEEAGRYLETYKAFESKPPDLIMEKTEGTFLSKFTDSITSVKKVNKTDAMTLLSTFGTFEKIVGASEEDLSLCSGFGPQKAQQLHRVLNEPFLKPNKRKLPKGDDEKETRPKKSPGKPSA